MSYTEDSAAPSRAPSKDSRLSALVQEWAADGLRDIVKGINRPQLWLTIGWLDVRQRYRRSVLGPLWITLSVGVFVAGLGIVYAGLFGQDLADYLPFLGVGIIIWMLISALISEGCMAFIGAEGAIKQMPVPLSVHVLRMVWRNLLIFAHHVLIYFVLVAIFPVALSASIFLVVPGLLIIALNGFGLGLLLGVLSARFRDIPIIMTNMIQLVFFTTPILWRKETLPPNRAWVAEYNPFYYLIENVRGPLLGEPAILSNWIISIAFTVATLAIGFAFFARFRKRIAYWL